MVWKRVIAAFVVLALVMSVLAMLKVHYVRDELNGSLLWNAQEAYLFLGVADLATRLTTWACFGNGLWSCFPLEHLNPTISTITWSCSESRRITSRATP